MFSWTTDGRSRVWPTLQALLAACLLLMAWPAPASAAQPADEARRAEGDAVHVVAQGETLWAIAVRYDSSVDALAAANELVDPGLIYVGQALRIPGSSEPFSPEPIVAPAATPTPEPLSPATPAARDSHSRDPDATAEPSALLQVNVHHYVDMARSNVRTVDGRRAIVPSPIYANGIYARDAFYAAFGIEDPDLSDESYRWFEGAQNPETGQITTAVPFDPTDASLQPQDDETTLLFTIWSGILHRSGRPIDRQVVERAWAFVQGHVEDGQYVSAPGDFRYWADCWQLSGPDVIAYNQGFYALAARFALEMGLSGVTEATVTDAVSGYRAIYRPDLGFLPLSAWDAGNGAQDVSALLPELLYRYHFDEGLLDDAAVLSSVDHNLATASITGDDGSLVGIKNIAAADGGFAYPANFSCTSMRRPGDYHNGGYWPMYTLAELALAYGIESRTSYRTAIETLVEQELGDGSPKEYWELSPGREGTLQPGRDDYSWNALLVPVFRWAGLIE